MGREITGSKDEIVVFDKQEQHPCSRRRIHNLLNSASVLEQQLPLSVSCPLCRRLLGPGSLEAYLLSACSVTLSSNSRQRTDMLSRAGQGKNGSGEAADRRLVQEEHQEESWPLPAEVSWHFALRPGLKISADSFYTSTLVGHFVPRRKEKLRS